jgi:hypothetical protein
MGSSTLVSCAQDNDTCFYEASSASCSTGLLCERSVPTSCVDPNWAEWPMPNVQVDVSAGAPNLSSYTDNGDGTVTDNVTQLMWQQAVSGTYTWAQAQTHCAAVTVAGHSDWRLPSQIEVESIIDYGQATAPFISGTYFPSTPASEFWSSTPLVGGTTGWPVFFMTGYPGAFTATGSYPVRCVR